MSHCNPKVAGTLQWLKQGKSLDEPWTLYPIDNEPSIHRIRFIDVEGNGKPALVSVPLMGRGATAGKNWLDGAPVRVTAYRITKDPAKDRWEPIVLDESLHVCHNFCTADGIERLWEVSETLLESPPPVKVYSPGSWGPQAIYQLIAPYAWRLPFERAWRDPNVVGA